MEDGDEIDAMLHQTGGSAFWAMRGWLWEVLVEYNLAWIFCLMFDGWVFIRNWSLVVFYEVLVWFCKFGSEDLHHYFLLLMIRVGINFLCSLSVFFFVFFLLEYTLIYCFTMLPCRRTKDYRVPSSVFELIVFMLLLGMGLLFAQYWGISTMVFTWHGVTICFWSTGCPLRCFWAHFVPLWLEQWKSGNNYEFFLGYFPKHC